MEREFEDLQQEQSLREGLIYKRFIRDDGKVEDVYDNLFPHIITTAAVSFYPVNIAVFFTEVDMGSEVPNLRVFRFQETTYKLVDIPFDGWVTGFRGVAEALSGENAGIRYGIEMSLFKVIRVMALP